MMKCIKHRLINIFSFNDTAGRLDYLIVFISLTIIAFLPALIDYFLFDLFMYDFLYYLYFILIILTFANVSRRLTDMGMNLLWMLLLFIPIINLLFQVYLIFSPSKNKK